MPLQPGELVPEVKLITHDMQWITLAAFRGEPLVLFFFPLAFSDTCTQEMCTVAQDYGAYHDLGAQVAGVSVDSPYVLERFRAESGAGFPFLSDFHREAAEAFGVLRTAPLRSGLRGTSERAAFVIDAESRIAYTWVGEHPGLLPPFAELKQALQRLR